jgi:hypothetical protein
MLRIAITGTGVKREAYGILLIDICIWDNIFLFGKGKEIR